MGARAFYSRGTVVPADGRSEIEATAWPPIDSGDRSAPADVGSTTPGRRASPSDAERRRLNAHIWPRSIRSWASGSTARSALRLTAVTR